MREVGQEEARALLTLQHERLNDLLAKTWPVATDPNHPDCLRAISAPLRIMEQMNSLQPTWGVFMNEDTHETRTNGHHGGPRGGN